MFEIYSYNIRIINTITVLILKMWFLKLRQIVNTFNFLQYNLVITTNLVYDTKSLVSHMP